MTMPLFDRDLYRRTDAPRPSDTEINRMFEKAARDQKRQEMPSLEEIHRALHPEDFAPENQRTQVEPDPVVVEAMNATTETRIPANTSADLGMKLHFPIGAQHSPGERLIVEDGAAYEIALNLIRSVRKRGKKSVNSDVRPKLEETILARVYPEHQSVKDAREKLSQTADVFDTEFEAMHLLDNMLETDYNEFVPNEQDMVNAANSVGWTFDLTFYSQRWSDEQALNLYVNYVNSLIAFRDLAGSREPREKPWSVEKQERRDLEAAQENARLALARQEAAKKQAAKKRPHPRQTVQTDFKSSFYGRGHAIDNALPPERDLD